MSLGLIRMVAAIVGIVLALATVTFLPMWLVAEGWWYLGEWFNWHYPQLWLPEWEGISSVWDYPPFSLAGRRLPYPPSNEELVKYALILMVGGMVIISALSAWLPLRYRIKAVCGHPGVRLPAQHAHQQYVNALSDKYSTGKIEVRSIPSTGINAFVLSTPSNRHVIVVSDGLFAQPPAIVQWVLTHEVGHVRYGDTQSTSLWLTAFKSIRLLDSLRTSVMNFLLRFIAALPLLRLFVWPVFFVFRIITGIGRVGQWAGSLVFLLVDRWVSRRMEYRADRFAVEHAGSEPGLFFFQYLVGAFEPTFNLLATHPKNIERYEAILTMSETNKEDQEAAPL